MTVAELIEALREFPSEAVVSVETDACLRDLSIVHITTETGGGIGGGPPNVVHQVIL